MGSHRHSTRSCESITPSSIAGSGGVPLTLAPMDPSADWSPSLLQAVRAGEPEATSQLERVFRPAMLRYCRGFLRDAQEAEDAVQEVFLKVLGSEAVPDSPRAWVYRIARNHCLNRLRSRARRRDDAPLASELDLAASLSGAATRLGRREELEQLVARLQALPEELREVLSLRYSEGLGREEIAGVLEIPVSTVKTRLFEGMKQLRAASGPAPD